MLYSENSVTDGSYKKSPYFCEICYIQLKCRIKLLGRGECFQHKVFFVFFLQFDHIHDLYHQKCVPCVTLFCDMCYTSIHSLVEWINLKEKTKTKEWFILSTPYLPQQIPPFLIYKLFLERWRHQADEWRSTCSVKLRCLTLCLIKRVSQGNEVSIF